MSLYVLDALICIDHDKFFLSQLQSRGFLRSCFMSISNMSSQVSGMNKMLRLQLTWLDDMMFLIQFFYSILMKGLSYLFYTFIVF